MGSFRVRIEIANPEGARVEAVEALVDTGATYTMVPRDLLQRLGVQPEEEWPLVLADGRRCSGYIPNAKGEPECPLSAAEIEAKFLTLTRDILPGGGEQVRDLVMGLETLTDLSALTASLKSCS